MKFNPELFSEKPTHLFDGVKVKVFKSTRAYSHKGDVIWTAEIMEGESIGKWTTVYESRLKKINE